VTSKEKALALCHALVERKGQDIRALDLAEVSAFTDFFVIATGSSDRHVKSLADAVLETARALGEHPIGVEGQQLGRWILIDLADVVVHVFQQEARDFYDLERLWGEAERIDVVASAGTA
jgi:ribosome-associated protein